MIVRRLRVFECDECGVMSRPLYVVPLRHRPEDLLLCGPDADRAGYRLESLDLVAEPRPPGPQTGRCRPE